MSEMRTASAVGFGLLLSGLLGSSVGCGGLLYSTRINDVESKIESAKELGAESLSPYEYYLAKEHVAKAKEEASRADYGDALDLLEDAEKAALKAMEQARAVRKGSGR